MPRSAVKFLTGATKYLAINRSAVVQLLGRFMGCSSIGYLRSTFWSIFFSAFPFTKHTIQSTWFWLHGTAVRLFVGLGDVSAQLPKAQMSALFPKLTGTANVYFDFAFFLTLLPIHRRGTWTNTLTILWTYLNNLLVSDQMQNLYSSDAQQLPAPV